MKNPRNPFNYSVSAIGDRVANILGTDFSEMFGGYVYDDADVDSSSSNTEDVGMYLFDNATSRTIYDGIDGDDYVIGCLRIPKVKDGEFIVCKSFSEHSYDDGSDEILREQYQRFTAKSKEALAQEIAAWAASPIVDMR